MDVDGCAVRLYHYLWAKVRAARRRDCPSADDAQDPSGRSPTSFRMPDTVIYKYKLPIQWFFSGRNGEVCTRPVARPPPPSSRSASPQLLRKRQPNVIATNIIESFRRQKV